MKANWNYPTSIRFGPGRVSELGEACKELGIERPLLVTDPDLARLPPIAEAARVLEAAGIPLRLFTGVQANPTERNVSDGLMMFRTEDCDGVVAIGGGSPLDAGKTIAMMAGQERPLWDFEDVGDNWTRVHELGMAPVVAVPTTSGTGAEVGRAAVITDSQQRSKRLIFHPNMMPGRVIADPELTAGMPAKLTVYTGFDALAHCLEAFCAPGFHPMADGIALEGLALIRDNLRKVAAEPQNMEARGAMLTASIMGAVAFQKGLGAIHSLSHPVGGRYDTHHGLLNAVFMPYVLEFNRQALDGKWERMGAVLGADPLQWVLDMRAELGIPATLAELEIDEKVVELAAAASADPSAATNPRPLDDASHRTLLERAFKGGR
jgi:alcohol dehydrogenase class IV